MLEEEVDVIRTGESRKRLEWMVEETGEVGVLLHSQFRRCCSSLLETSVSWLVSYRMMLCKSLKFD